VNNVKLYLCLTKMSGRYHKVKHQRLSKSTHFQETNVTMKPLNDPIPPNHPGSPEPPIKRRTDGGRGGERYLNIDLSGSTLPKRKIEHLNPDVGQQDPESHKKSQTTSRGKSRSTYSETLFEEYQDLPVKYSLSQSMYFKGSNERRLLTLPWWLILVNFFSETRRLLQEVDNISKMYLAGKGEKFLIDVRTQNLFYTLLDKCKTIQSLKNNKVFFDRSCQF